MYKTCYFDDKMCVVFLLAEGSLYKDKDKHAPVAVQGWYGMRIGMFMISCILSPSQGKVSD